MIVKVVIVDGDLTTDVTLQGEPKGYPKGGKADNDNGDEVIVLEDPIAEVANIFLQAMQGAGMPVKNIAIERNDDLLLWARPDEG